MSNTGGRPADDRARRERGVVGSPHFFTPDGAFFCPALDIARVDGHLRISAKAGMFDEFITACFGHA